MKRLRILAVVMFVCLLASSAFSQDDGYDWEKDYLEFTLFGAVGVPTSGITDFGPNLNAQTGWSIGGELGYFISYKVTMGLSFQYTRFGVDSDFDGQLTQHHQLFSPTIYAKYSFVGESNWEPYLTARAGLDFPKFSTDIGGRWRELSYNPVFSMGGSAGLFYFTSDASGLYLEAGYHHGFSESTSGKHQDISYTFGENIEMVDVRLGIRILVGPGS